MKNETKAARLIALGFAIQNGYFDPDTVNMSEMAKVFEVDRSTIMRDLEVVNDVIETTKKYQAILRDKQFNESLRRK